MIYLCSWKLNKWLFRTFEMKDLGELSHILGIKKIKSIAFRKLSLSQKSYINTILRKFKMDNCNDAMIPCVDQKILGNNDYPSVS